MKDQKSFLGHGWSFPPSFSYNSRGVEIVSEEEDILQSLHILLSTSRGERVMNPDYGCNLQKLVFEPLSNSLLSEIADKIRQAINLFEARIRFDSIDVAETEDPLMKSGGIVFIRVNYTILSSNTRSNIVYPYYKIEGTNISLD